MSLLVFLGVYAISSLIELLVNPPADDFERARATAAWARPADPRAIRDVPDARGERDLGGRSCASRDQLIFAKLPATLELAFVAMAMAIALGIPLGLVAGLKPHSWIGRGIMAGSILGFSLPTFWVGLVLIMVFSVQLGWLPPNGRGETVLVAGIPVSFLTADGLAHLAMPALNLALFKLSLLVRLTRAGTREAMLQDYV